MDCRYHNFGIWNITEILHRRFKYKLSQVAIVFGTVSLLEHLHAATHVLQTLAHSILAESLLLRLLPCLISDEWWLLSAVNTLHKITHLHQIAKPQSFQRLYQFGFYTATVKQRKHNNRFLVGLRQYARSSIATLHYVVGNGQKHVFGDMTCYSYLTIIITHRQNRGCLKSIPYRLDKIVCCSNNEAWAAIVLRHLNETSTRFLAQLIHILRVWATKLIDILVVIANSNDSHILIGRHKSRNQSIVVTAHILCFVNYKHRLADVVLLHLTIVYHLGSLCHYTTHIVKIAYTPEQVEAIRMECLYLYKVGSIANKLHQSLLELSSSSTRECKHKQLLMLHIFKQQ